MKRIEQHRWRVLWAGKWKTTSYHCTEEEIRAEHPEAERVEDTLRVMEIAETAEERVAQELANSTSAFLKR